MDEQDTERIDLTDVHNRLVSGELKFDHAQYRKHWIMRMREQAEEKRERRARAEQNTERRIQAIADARARERREAANPLRAAEEITQETQRLREEFQQYSAEFDSWVESRNKESERLAIDRRLMAELKIFLFSRNLGPEQRQRLLLDIDEVIRDMPEDRHEFIKAVQQIMQQRDKEADSRRDALQGSVYQDVSQDTSTRLLEEVNQKIKAIEVLQQMSEESQPPTPKQRPE